MLLHYLSSHGNYKVKQLQKVKRNTTLNLQLFFPYIIICLNVCNGNSPIRHVLSHWIPLIFAQQDSKTEVLDLLSSYLCFTRKANRNERFCGLHQYRRQLELRDSAVASSKLSVSCCLLGDAARVILLTTLHFYHVLF